MARPGTEFEKAIAAMQSKIDPTTAVTHDEVLVDRLGHPRQFDVVLRGKTGGHEILGVIECKDYGKKRTGVPDVDAFVTKARDVNANLTLLASRTGFTKRAIQKANDYGIGLISLLPGDDEKCGFRVGGTFYVRIYQWTRFGVQVQLKGRSEPISEFTPSQVCYRKMPVADWLLHFLALNHGQYDTVGWHDLELAFDKPRRLSLDGQLRMCTGLSFRAERTTEVRKRFVQFMGDGLMRWPSGQVTLPPGAQLKSTTWRADFADWELVEGDIPPRQCDFDVRMIAHIEPDPAVLAPRFDLAVL